jgi:hypothetical protein
VIFEDGATTSQKNGVPINSLYLVRKALVLDLAFLKSLQSTSTSQMPIVVPFQIALIWTVHVLMTRLPSQFKCQKPLMHSGYNKVAAGYTRSHVMQDPSQHCHGGRSLQGCVLSV